MVDGASKKHSCSANQNEITCSQTKSAQKCANEKPKQAAGASLPSAPLPMQAETEDLATDSSVEMAQSHCSCAENCFGCDLGTVFAWTPNIFHVVLRESLISRGPFSILAVGVLSNLILVAGIFQI